MDEMAAKIEEVKAQIQVLAGVVSSYTAWRADGHGVTTAIYVSQAAAEAASEQIQAIWGGMAEFLIAAPRVETYDNVEDLKG